MELLPKLLKFSDENNLIAQNDSILIALSGGADSITLLHLLSRLRKKLNLTLSAVYVNHQLRKKASKQEELFCQELCESLGIELHLASVDIKTLAEKNKKGIEETARDYRYQLFETLAQEYNYTRVALGHHQNDQVETILFRIFRGTGMTGLKGIPPMRDLIIRPLLGISKNEILEYIEMHELSFCQDASNKQSVFKRNYIRNKLIPLLKTNLNQSVEKAILNLSDTIADEDAYLGSIVQKKMKKILSRSVGNKVLLQKEKLLQCDRWIQNRILRSAISSISTNQVFPDKVTIDRLRDSIIAGKPSLSLKGKIEMKSLPDSIVLYPRQKLSFTHDLILNQNCDLENLNYIVKARKKNRTTKSLNENKQGMIGRFDFDKIVFPLTVRSLKDGDQFRPLGMRGSKKIRNFLTDKKVDPVFRDETVVVTDKNSIFWVVGYQIDERLKIDKNTKKVLEIECKRK